MGLALLIMKILIVQNHEKISDSKKNSSSIEYIICILFFHTVLSLNGGWLMKAKLLLQQSFSYVQLSHSGRSIVYVNAFSYISRGLSVVIC